MMARTVATPAGPDPGHAALTAALSWASAAPATAEEGTLSAAGRDEVVAAALRTRQN